MQKSHEMGQAGQVDLSESRWNGTHEVVRGIAEVERGIEEGCEAKEASQGQVENVLLWECVG